MKTLLGIVAHNYGKEGRRREKERGEEKGEKKEKEETENRDSSLIQTRS